MQTDTVRTAAAVVANWIKLKKIYSKVLKKINNRQRELVCSLKEESSDGEVTDLNEILFSVLIV